MFIYSLNIDLSDEIDEFIDGCRKVREATGMLQNNDLRVVAQKLVGEVVELAADAKEEQMKEQILQQVLGGGS